MRTNGHSISFEPVSKPLTNGSRPAARVRQIAMAILLPALVVALAFVYPASAQQARRLWDTQLIQQSKAQTGASPKAAKKASTKTASAEPAPVYTTPDPAAAPLTENDAIVGITVWNLRPAKSSGEVTLRDKAKKINWTPERIEGQTPLDEGAQVRLSIEAPREGYLYVIDREQYADGSTGDPYLIFPTKRTAGGDNKVVSGRVIEVPAQEDNPPYFTLKRSRKDQTAELIQIIVSAEPLPGINIGRNALKLSNEQVAEWNSKWGGKAERFELADGAGKPWTKAEKEAGLRTRLLVQEEPMPQTLYRIPSEPGQPVMIQVPLTIVE
jgi:hypothetical protein